MPGACCRYEFGEESAGKVCRPATGPTACMGDEWYESGSCAIDSALSHHLEIAPEKDLLRSALASGTYSTLYQFRDLLAKTSVGQRFISYNLRFSKEILRVLSTDPELSHEVVGVILLAASFAHAMLLEQSRRSQRRGYSRYILTKEILERGANTGERIKALTEDRELIQALDDVRGIATRFVGLTPREALDLLQKEDFS